MSNTSFWLNAFMFGHEEQQAPDKLRQRKKFPFDEHYGGECPGVYYHRLQRDGWRLQSHGTENRSDGYSLFEKTLPGGWILEKTAHATIDHPVGKGCYYDTHCLIHPAQELILNFPDWEWADLDRKRLVWVEKGVLNAARITSMGPVDTQQLHDFNPMKFEALKAPY